MFKHASIDAFECVCVCRPVCVVAGGLVVSSAPVQFAIKLWQTELRLSVAFPEIPRRSCVVPSAA